MLRTIKGKEAGRILGRDSRLLRIERGFKKQTRRKRIMKRKLVTKIVSVAMASCMMAGMLTGCGSSGDGASAGENTSGGG